MSSVLLTNMSFPKSCAKPLGANSFSNVSDFEQECPFVKLVAFENYVVCPLLYNARVTDPTNNRHPSCPLRKVPDDHGVLIDKEAAMKLLEPLVELQEPYKSGVANAIVRAIDELPVIIKAEIKEKK